MIANGVSQLADLRGHQGKLALVREKGITPTSEPPTQFNGKKDWADWLDSGLYAHC
jgi:hypothetical protein